MATLIDTSAPVEKGARNALLVWGAGMLVAGLGLVGIGKGWEGAPLALAGLFNTIYGIHTYGRLGPDDEQADADAEARAGRSSAVWTGALTALAGLLVVADHYLGFSGTQQAGGTWAVSAYGLAVIGLARAVRAARAGGAPASKAKAKRKRKVENRARMDKSRAP